MKRWIFRIAALAFVGLVGLVGFGTGAALAQDPGQDPASQDSTAGAAAEMVEPLVLRLSLTPEEITVGDHVEAELVAVWMGGDLTGAARMPTWQDTWGKAEVLEVQPTVTAPEPPARQVWRQTVVLTAFEPGEVTLPPVTVSIPVAERTVEARTEPVTFTVRSVLAEESAEEAQVSGQPAQPGEPPAIPDPKPAAGLAELDVSGIKYPATLVGLLTLIGLASVLMVHRLVHQPAESAAERAPVDPLRLLPPVEELERRLEAIDPGTGDERVHTALSMALRTYLGRRLDFRAMESTTTDIQRSLRRAALGQAVSTRILTLLRQCDAAKYARLEVGADACRRRLVEARDLGRAVEHQMAPTPLLDETTQGSAGPGSGGPGPDGPGPRGGIGREVAA